MAVPGPCGVRVDLGRVLDDGEANPEPDLRSGQPDPRRGDHRLAHRGQQIGQQFAGQLAVVGEGGSAQDRVARMDQRHRPRTGQQPFDLLPPSGLHRARVSR